MMKNEMSDRRKVAVKRVEARKSRLVSLSKMIFGALKS